MLNNVAETSYANAQQNLRREFDGTKYALASRKTFGSPAMQLLTRADLSDIQPSFGKYNPDVLTSV